MTTTAYVTYCHADGTRSLVTVPEDALRREMPHAGAVYGLLDLAIHYDITEAIYGHIEDVPHAPRA